MAPEWDITPDHVAVVHLAETICGLPAMSWSAQRCVSWPVIGGASFRVRFWSVPDRIGDRIQLYVYFEPLSGFRLERPWSAWARCDAKVREDRVAGRLAKRLRRAFIPFRMEECEAVEGGSAPKIARTAHWWVAGSNPRRERDDIAAQVWLFLLQTRIITSDTVRATATAWFWNYLERAFRLTAGEESDVFEDLLKHYWRPVSAGSWRTYVASWIFRHPARVARRRSSAPRQSPIRSAADVFTVTEAARFLGVSPSTAYEWIRNGRIRTTKPSPVGENKSVTLVSRSELERAKETVRPKPKAIIELTRATGSTYEAARKSVWRQRRRGLTAADIVRQLSTRNRTARA
jgi:excisionase family DNA binding protein